MWLTAEYEATALFSLKPALSTASGAKTLLVPTPFAVKMALLDVACRLEGQSAAEQTWTWINDLTVAVRPAERVVVNNTFIKILRPRRSPAQPGSQDAGHFQRTIAYREYAYFDEPFALALKLTDDADADRLTYWLTCINYLGKRGSFIQVTGPPQQTDELSESFIVIDGEIGEFHLEATLTQLDDTSANLTFEQANIYSTRRITLGKDRILRHAVLPYRLVSSSRGYSFYERLSS